MRLQTTFEIAYHGLFMKSSRTFLTLLGVSIGISAVILIASLGDGTQKLITDEISGIGSDVMAVQPGAPPESLADVTNTLFSQILTKDDIDAILKKENVPHAIDASPFVIVPTSVISYGNETYVPQIIGAEATTYGKIFNVYPNKGILFGDEEVT